MICPLRTTADNDGNGFDGDCKYENCAWWIANGCAVTWIASRAFVDNRPPTEEERNIGIALEPLARKRSGGE